MQRNFFHNNIMWRILETEFIHVVFPSFFLSSSESATRWTGWSGLRIAQLVEFPLEKKMPNSIPYAASISMFLVYLFQPSLLDFQLFFQSFLLNTLSQYLVTSCPFFSLCKTMCTQLLLLLIKITFLHNIWRYEITDE